MISRFILGFITICLLLGIISCASTEVVQVSRNQAVISTSAAPVCGTEGALKVAQKMAAVATLRQGYKRFILSGVGSYSNVQINRVPSSYSYTTGTVNVYGNSGFGNFQTYTPTRTQISGRNHAEMQVLMLNQEDSGYQNALDAKEVLGSEWKKIVEKGIWNCN